MPSRSAIRGLSFGFPLLTSADDQRKFGLGYLKRGAVHLPFFRHALAWPGRPNGARSLRWAPDRCPVPVPHVAQQEDMEMTTMDLAPLWRSSIGFDRFFDLLENSARWNPGDHYPPYNIE